MSRFVAPLTIGSFRPKADLSQAWLHLTYGCALFV